MARRSSFNASAASICHFSAERKAALDKSTFSGIMAPVKRDEKVSSANGPESERETVKALGDRCAAAAFEQSAMSGTLRPRYRTAKMLPCGEDN